MNFPSDFYLRDRKNVTIAERDADRFDRLKRGTVTEDQQQLRSAVLAGTG